MVWTFQRVFTRDTCEKQVHKSNLKSPFNQNFKFLPSNVRPTSQITAYYSWVSIQPAFTISLSLSRLGLPLWLNWLRIRLQWGRPGFDPWVGKIPWKRKRLPTPAFWPGEFHELHSPCGHTESDMTERLSLSLFLSLDWAEHKICHLNFRIWRRYSFSSWPPLNGFNVTAVPFWLVPARPRHVNEAQLIW